MRWRPLRGELDHIYMHNWLQKKIIVSGLNNYKIIQHCFCQSLQSLSPPERFSEREDRMKKNRRNSYS